MITQFVVKNNLSTIRAIAYPFCRLARKSPAGADIWNLLDKDKDLVLQKLNSFEYTQYTDI